MDSVKAPSLKKNQGRVLQMAVTLELGVPEADVRFSVRRAAALVC